MNIKFGYARVSRENQNLDMQIDALLAYGVQKENIYAEKESGAKDNRKELEKLLMLLREGDMVVFYDLSRVGRDFLHLCTLVEIFEKQEINFKDLTNPIIDTSHYQTPEGKLVYRIFASIVTFFREQSNDKVRRGLESARKRGRVGGRPKGISKNLREKASNVAKLYLQTDMSIKDISKTLQIAPNSVYKCLKHEGVKIKLNTNRAAKNNAA